MGRRLADQVVVVTGASQGIGRETALRLGASGAAVVVAARNETALRELATEIERLGGRAESVVADVADHRQVERIGAVALARFGRVDTWVNNAAVSIYGTVEQVDPPEMERLVQVNLLGLMYGSKVAATLMKDTGGGTIINVGSALSDRAIPLQAAYVGSKHGVAGFSEALRLELKQEDTQIDVVVILPSSINTPLFDFARSKLGVQPMPVPPVYAPAVVAEAICHAAEHGGREIVVGGSGKLLMMAQRLSPSLLDRYMLQGNRAFEQQKTDRPDDRRDNLFEASTGPGSTTGQFGTGSRHASWYTRHLELHPARKRASAIALLVGLAALIRRIGR
ncbi:MAG: family NAD(P)-dependent oxidoreductase [Chloroflexota bacterium]|jgi:short-subunit dehydrogenase|nr:family NAD(P)-dependent oxidoreductase [Chloroflexota bacterium]